MAQRRDDPVRIARWPLWSLPRPVLLVILGVELLAVASLVVGFVNVEPLREPWPIVLVVLVAAGIISTEASIGVERVRRQTDETPHIDLSSVWAFAAAALLPGPLAGTVVVLIYGYMYLRVWRGVGVPPHRVLFSTATVVLAVQAAVAVVALAGQPDPFHSTAGLLALLGGVISYAVVNMLLVVTAIVLSGQNRSFAAFRQVLGHGDDAVLELATLSMGALTAAAMATYGAAYALLVLPPLFLLHRTVLVRQLEEEANTDSKTGLLNAAAWHLEADRVLDRLERIDGSATVLLLDLDNFKQVNDEHGHLVGDQVLAAVATAIQGAVRDDDLVGRFGGEEFVVLLAANDPEPGRAGAEAVANRIRRRVAELRVEGAGTYGELVITGLSVSIGGATFGVDGTELPDLLTVADAAMYAAKDAGRDRVVMGPPAIRGASRVLGPDPDRGPGVVGDEAAGAPALGEP